MHSPYPTRTGESRGRTFTRHYHRGSHERTAIASWNRRDIESLRRVKRSRLCKWFAIGITLPSSVAGCLLILGAWR